MLTSDIIKAHKEIILSQQEATIRSIYRLRILLEEEFIISTAWKYFVISLRNLDKKDDDTMKEDYEESRKSIEEELHEIILSIMITNMLKIYPRFIQDWL